jgi:hypothetical protein
MELRAYFARYPFDDESNTWLPMGMLIAEVRNKFATAGSDPASAFDFMPFRPKGEDLAAEGDPGAFLFKRFKDW